MYIYTYISKYIYTYIIIQVYLSVNVVAIQTRRGYKKGKQLSSRLYVEAEGSGAELTRRSGCVLAQPRLCLHQIFNTGLLDNLRGFDPLHKND